MKNMGFINEKIIKNNLINLDHIIFEVTERCNLKCKYCALSDQLYKIYNMRKSRDMPFKKAQLMIDYLINLWRENYLCDTNIPLIVGFYGGEPLMNISLIKKIINYFEQNNIIGRQIFYSMTTNALLLDKHIDFLAEKGFHLAISMDGNEFAQSYRIDKFEKNSFNAKFGSYCL